MRHNVDYGEPRFFNFGNIVIMIFSALCGAILVLRCEPVGLCNADTDYFCWRPEATKKIDAITPPGRL